jgi:hypothetical protein
LTDLRLSGKALVLFFSAEKWRRGAGLPVGDGRFISDGKNHIVSVRFAPKPRLPRELVSIQSPFAIIYLPLRASQNWQLSVESGNGCTTTFGTQDLLQPGGYFSLLFPYFAYVRGLLDVS